MFTSASRFIDLVHLLDVSVASAGAIAEPMIKRFAAWVPRYPIAQAQQLWLEARLDNEVHVERLVAVAPSV